MFKVWDSTGTERVTVQATIFPPVGVVDVIAVEGPPSKL